MKYFESLIPTITQQSNVFYDMFENFDITKEIDQEFLITYSMRDGETLQDVALNFYDDPQLWWLICLTNNIKDPIFDIARSSDYIQKVAIELASHNPLFWTGSDSDLFWTGLDSDLFWFLQIDYITEYDAATALNDDLRTINVIKPEFLSDVISQILQIARG